MVNNALKIIPAAVFMLSLGIFLSCGTTQKNIEETPQKVEQTDTVKEFIPLHPPVVIRRHLNDRTNE